MNFKSPFLRSILSAVLILLIFSSPGLSVQELFNVVRVVDGDTIIINYQGQKEKVRMIGVDTPETVDPRRPVQYYGQEASNFTKSMLSQRTIRLEFDWNKRDHFGRLLAYINLPASQAKNAPGCAVRTGAGDIDFNASLISCGYAHAYTKFPFSRMDKYRGYEQQARSSNRGLWSNGKPDNGLPKEYRKTGNSLVAGRYVASSNSEKFHRTDCSWARKISANNLIGFQTREEAIRAGLKPCGVCKP